jgi:hypothetical protein
MTLADYNQCVDHHADGLYRFILKQVKDKDASKDIVQDAFEKMWRKLDTIDAAKSKTYLFTTGYHSMIDYFRKQNNKSLLKDYIELWLMSLCKNNILSNSSFSWWGSFLNENLNKKIIAPSVWFGPKGPKNYSDIFENNWQIINVHFENGELNVK